MLADDFVDVLEALEAVLPYSIAILVDITLQRFNDRSKRPGMTVRNGNIQCPPFLTRKLFKILCLDMIVFIRVLKNSPN
jgi:hypothetical protein